MKIKSIQYLSLLIVLFLFSGCSSVLFYPKKDLPFKPDFFEVDYEPITIETKETYLSGWFLKAKTPSKGTIVFLHGNGGNISYNLFSSFWLPHYGYNVIAFDYSGYGLSKGEPTLEKVNQDIHLIFDWAIAHTKKDKKLFVYGQSLGGALAITNLAQYPQQSRFEKLIVEGGFTRYKTIANEMSKKNLFSYPLSWFSFIVEHEALAPINNIEKIDIPLVILHGKQDKVINYHHALQLYRKAKEPKSLWLVEGYGHIDITKLKKNRERIIELIEQKEIHLR